jgi:hypothetical protein
MLVVTFRLREHRFGPRPTFSRCEHCATPGHLAYGFIADGWVARLCNTAHRSRQNPTEVALPHRTRDGSQICLSQGH